MPVPLSQFVACTQAQLTAPPVVLVNAALASLTAQEVEVAPAAVTCPVPTVALDANESFYKDFDLPTWMDQDEERRHLSVSSDDDSIFEPAPCSMMTYSEPLVETRPVLQPRDVVMAARSAYGTAQAQLIVPTLLSHFEPTLSAPELTARLQWL